MNYIIFSPAKTFKVKKKLIQVKGTHSGHQNHQIT